MSIETQDSLRIRKDTKDIYMNYNLRRTRISCRISQLELGIRVGVENVTICSYERLRSFPNQETAEKIARVLGADVAYLFPESLREISLAVNAERRSSKRDRVDVEYVGSNLGDIEENLSQEIPADQDVFSILNFHELREKMGLVLQTLNWRERTVVRLRYGLGGDGYIHGKRYSFAEISRVLGLTRERIRQIEAKAILRLQHPVRAKMLQGFV